MVKMKLKINAKKVDKYLLNFLNKQKKTLLVKPMKYGTISGGKKIRSTVIFDVGKLLKIKQKKLISICAAVECIHSYSLIHDDLPCMDNDLFRRANLQSIKIWRGNSSIGWKFIINFSIRNNFTRKKFIVIQ